MLSSIPPEVLTKLAAIEERKNAEIETDYVPPVTISQAV